MNFNKGFWNFKVIKKIIYILKKQWIFKNIINDTFKKYFINGQEVSSSSTAILTLTQFCTLVWQGQWVVDLWPFLKKHVENVWIIMTQKFLIHICNLKKYIYLFIFVKIRLLYKLWLAMFIIFLSTLIFFKWAGVSRSSFGVHCFHLPLLGNCGI